MYLFTVIWLIYDFFLLYYFILIMMMIINNDVRLDVTSEYRALVGLTSEAKFYSA